MTDTKGKVVAINGNMISVKFDGDVALNEVGYVKVAGKSLKSEVIRIRGGQAQLQVFEMTKGISTYLFPSIGLILNIYQVLYMVYNNYLPLY